MNTLSGKITAAVLSLFLLAYVVFNVWRFFYSPIKTETVIDYTIQDTLQVKGLVIRDEIPVRASADGVVRYYYEDGVRVIPGMAVAEVRESREAVLNTLRAAQLEEEAALLRQVQEEGETSISYDSALRQAQEALGQIIAMNDSGMVEGGGELASTLQQALNKRQAVTGEKTDFSARIAALEAEREALVSGDDGALEVISAPEYGYFSSYCDEGAEEISVSLLEECTAAELAELAAKKYPVDRACAGKVIEGYQWYYAALVDGDEAVKFTPGVQVSLSFSGFSSASVPGTVVKLITDEDGTSAVVFECSYMSPQLSALRNPSAQVEFKTYSGLKIPNRALRFEDGVQGVYTSDGQQVRFKRVEVLYEGVDFFLSAMDGNDPERVQLYDDIIVEGTDLYDGKPLGN
jgi:hypothetical protein